MTIPAIVKTREFEDCNNAIDYCLMHIESMVISMFDWCKVLEDHIKKNQYELALETITKIVVYLDRTVKLLGFVPDTEQPSFYK